MTRQRRSSFITGDAFLTKCPKCGHSWPDSSKDSNQKPPPIPISLHSGEACYDRDASTPSPLVPADPNEVINESDSRLENIALEFENTNHFRQVGLHAEHKKSSETSSSSNDSNGSAAGEAETSSMETVSSSSLSSKSQSQETQLAMQILSSFHEQSQKQRHETESESEKSCFDFQTEKAILQEMQRLKDIDMGGYSTAFHPGVCFSRFEHSLGVCFLLKLVI